MGPGISGLKILVTGANGFIGQHLIKRLLQENSHIRGFIPPGEDLSSLEQLGIEVLRGDICDYTSVERAVQNCDLIFHLAGKTEASRPSRKSFEEVNVGGTANIARAAVHTKVRRLVFCSSGAVYGRAIKNRNITEDTPLTPGAPYGRSKLLAEQILLSHHQQNGLPVVLARLAAVLGPGATSWVDLVQTLAHGLFRLIGAGQNHHHTVDVSDVGEGLMLCGSVKGIEGGIFLLAGSESVQLLELIHMMREDLGQYTLRKPVPSGPLPLYAYISHYIYRATHYRLPRADRIDMFFGDRTFNLSRSKKKLGYRPRISTREAVRRTTKWLREQDLLN